MFRVAQGFRTPNSLRKGCGHYPELTQNSLGTHDPLSVGVSYDALLWMNRSVETCHLHSEENGQWRDQVLRSSERPLVDATLYCYTNRCNLLLRSKSGENILILIIYLICQFLVSLTVYTVAHLILNLGDLYIYNIIRPITHVLCSLCLDTNHNSDLSCGPMFDIVPEVTEYFS